MRCEVLTATPDRPSKPKTTRRPRAAGMKETDVATAPTAPELDSTPDRDADPSPDAPIVEEILVEEVSIDGMCGVY